MDIDLYTQSGTKNGTVSLPKEIFEVPFKKDLIHQALIRQLSNQRRSTAHAKKRGEVRGGGRKPYAQKGTGRARQGSIRSPQWRGGGVVFGPRNVKNYYKDMPKTQRRAALFSALSEKAREDGIIALEGFNATAPKTKTFAELLKKLPIDRDVLIVIPGKDVIVQKSSSNIPNAKTILVNYMNIKDLQKFKKVLFFKDSIDKLKEVFLKKTK